ncbi:hypothetical protein, partial [Paenibacillus xylanexedens]|uniref:hypothetical protein n=1 Tax=Paenibacillus xylanexedens TaxID=528191 RepID=UPI001C92F748
MDWVGVVIEVNVVVNGVIRVLWIVKRRVRVNKLVVENSVGRVDRWVMVRVRSGGDSELDSIRFELVE